MKQKSKLKYRRCKRKDEKYAAMAIKRRQVEEADAKNQRKKRRNEEKSSLERDQE
jgi:hypothetical protein